MSQVKKMRVFKLTDSQLDLMLQSIRRTKRTSYERLRPESQKDFDLMFEEVVEPYNFWGELISPFFSVKIFIYPKKLWLLWMAEWMAKNLM